MNTSQEPAARPSPRRRFARWLISWRTLRRSLLSLACLATLIAIFYAVENWRGRRIWEACRRELEAKGVELNWDELISPPVSDDQNFYSAPEMAGWFVKPASTSDLTNGFHERLNHPATGSVMERNIITNVSDSAAYIRWSDQFQPEFNLIREALKRPYARINGIYDQPYEIPIPGFVTMRRVAQMLAQRAHCHLLLGNPGAAVEDLTLLHELRRVLEGRPTGKPMMLVAAMMNVAIAGVYSDAVSEGLQKSTWRESDLATLQTQLDEVRLLPVVTEGFRCERAAACRIMESRPELFAHPADADPLIKKLRNPAYLYSKLMPRGWHHQKMAAHAWGMQLVVEMFDPKAGVIRPRNVAAVHSAVMQSFHGSPSAYLNPNFVRALQTTAFKQTRVHQTQLACALERYRMANGVHPESLDLLVPGHIAALPHDILTGQPLKYHRSDDGGFVIHSVGWNETDDNGQEGAKGNFEDGDWIWRQPASAAR